MYQSFLTRLLPVYVNEEIIFVAWCLCDSAQCDAPKLLVFFFLKKKTFLFS